jgi:Response regulators consisting of a CheY-like receiver domain and a winged-helix DNA-binding domain
LRDLYHAEDDQSFEKIFERIVKYEDISDRMENEIGRYLGQVGDAHLSDETKEKIRSMLRQIGELESVGDSFYNLARILRRRREKKIEFTPEQVAAGQQMVSLVEEAMTRMNAALAGRREDADLGASVEIEKKINDLRNTLRQRNVTDVDNHVYTYEAGTVFMDLVTECEKTGDYVMNVVEARLGVDHKDLHFKGILIDTAAKVVTVDGEEVFFPRSEYALLKLFLENPGHVFSREDLLEFPWTPDVDNTDGTLDVNIGRVRRKIGPYAEFLLTGPGYGLLTEDRKP